MPIFSFAPIALFRLAFIQWVDHLSRLASDIRAVEITLLLIRTVILKLVTAIIDTARTHTHAYVYLGKTAMLESIAAEGASTLKDSATSDRSRPIRCCKTIIFSKISGH